MFENLEVFRISGAMAVHAGQKQAVAAENVANSDTPGFKARSIAPFDEAYTQDLSRPDASTLRSTRSTHLHGAVDGRLGAPEIDENAIAAPNGNTVSLENEMLKSLDAKRQHDRALAIYKSSISVLRSTLSRS
ncbi:MAG: FlgB family protein [Pseudomonadota bacterium]